MIGMINRHENTGGPGLNAIDDFITRWLRLTKYLYSANGDDREF